MEMYENEKHIEDTFTESNLSPYLLQAQWAEFVELKKIINEISSKKKDLIKILDIWIWDWRILRNLHPIKELWSEIWAYDGIDVAENCVHLSEELIKELWVSENTSVKRLNALNLDEMSKKYDLIISTWFTAWNFYPSDYNIWEYREWYDLSKNDTFTTIFTKAYEQLNDGWEIVIGSMYIDNDKTREKQEQAYKDFWREVVSKKEDSFVASSEGWWSQRFSKERIYEYLPNIPKENIKFVPLDTYDYAMLVRIKK